MDPALKWLLIPFLLTLTLAFTMALIVLRDRLKRRRKPAVTYEALRNQAIHMNRQQVGLSAAGNPAAPWAVIRDWGVDEDKTATVVAVADGTASVYFSTGGGSIGGGQSHEPIRIAAQRAVRIAAEFQPQMQKVTDCPLPRRREVTFYVVSEAGIFGAVATEADLREQRHLLSRLGNAMQDIITQYHDPKHQSD